MATNISTNKKRRAKGKEAMVQIPLSALRCILSYPKEKKIICEISTKAIKRVNDAKTLDEIINEARMDYTRGDYTSHRSAKSLIAGLRGS